MSQSQPRLKTSAMIASIADEGQATLRSLRPSASRCQNWRRSARKSSA